MDLWQLRIFCKVVEEKSFSGAGKLIRLSQPTVSNHIRDLEQHFGCRLIDRLAREALPTKAGELLYRYACKMNALREETEAALAEFQGTIKGRLAAGGSTIPGVHILPGIVGDFIKSYPEVTVSLSIGDTRKIVDETLSGQLEIGIVGAKTADRRIVQEKLVEDEMRVIVPGEHKWAGKKRISLKALEKEPFIIRESGSGTLKSIDKSLEKKGRTVGNLKVIAEMGSTGAVIQGIKNGIGVSILSPIAVSEELETGKLKALAVTGLDMKRSFYLTRSAHRTPSPLCAAFVRFLREKTVK